MVVLSESDLDSRKAPVKGQAQRLGHYDRIDRSISTGLNITFVVYGVHNQRGRGLRTAKSVERTECTKEKKVLAGSPEKLRRAASWQEVIFRVLIR